MQMPAHLEQPNEQAFAYIYIPTRSVVDWLNHTNINYLLISGFPEMVFCTLCTLSFLESMFMLALISTHLELIRRLRITHIALLVLVPVEIGKLSR